METNFDTLDKKILELLTNNGSMKAKELAKALNVERKEINSRLYSSLQHHCLRDDQFYWSVIQKNSHSVLNQFDEQTYINALKNGEVQLKEYLHSLDSESLIAPHCLFVKPAISGHIFSEETILTILNYLKNSGIDLNSTVYFLNRNDDLKGSNLIGGCLCFPIYYFIQGKNKPLQKEEVLMYAALVKNARKMGWNVNTTLSNNKTTKDLIYLLLSRGHRELQQVYDALFEDMDVNIQLFDINLHSEITDDIILEDSNESEDTPPEIAPASTPSVSVTDLAENNAVVTPPVADIAASLDELIILLRSLSINDYIDESFLSSDNTVGVRVHNMQKTLNYNNVEAFVTRYGFKVGPIIGNVGYDLSKSETSDSNVDNDFLNSEISEFSTRAYNKLRWYGVRTYADLLQLNIEEFATKRGVGVGVIEEVTERIRQIQASLEQKEEPSDLHSEEEDTYAPIHFSWAKVFTERDEFKSLFSITIPAALQRNEVLNHVCLKTNSFLVSKNFNIELKNALNQQEEIKNLKITGLTKAGDIGAFFTSINPGELVKIECEGKIKDEVLNLVATALNTYTLTVTIGKGPSAREVFLELPPFTAVFELSSNEELPAKFEEAVGIRIEANIEHDDMIKFEILDSASKYSFNLTQETLSLLCSRIKEGHAYTTVKLLSDYLYLHPELAQPVDAKKAEELLNILHV